MPSMRRLVLVVLLGAGLTCGRGGAEDRSPADEEADQAARLERLRQMAGEYRLLTRPGEERLELRTTPLLRWTNPLRKTDDGAVFLWTSNDRPAAIACLYTYGAARTDHEFQSLWPGLLEASRGDERVWHPEQAGLQFQTSTDAEAKPADAAPRRLGQMRAMARTFSTTLIRDDGSKDELRLLTQPLYRYAPRTGDVVDGAVFAYAQGTDPEVLILIEAVRKQGQLTWQSAFARMSSLALEARKGDTLVWSVPRWNWTPNPAEPYITFVNAGKAP